MKKRNYKFLSATIFLFLSFLLVITTKWALKNYNFTVDELIFHLKVPMKGANIVVLYDFFKKCLFKTTIYIALITIIIINPFKLKLNFKIKDKIINLYPIKINYTIYLLFTICLVFLSIYTSFNKIGLFTYLNNQTTLSTFIEENYVDTKDVKLTFKEEKKNLIYIFIESLEPTYLSKEVGGFQDEILMPNLTELSNKYTNFSNNSLIGGALTVPGVTWTIGAIVSQTSALPLDIPIESNSYGNYKTFLPGAYTLGEILAKEGYNQLFMIGSDATFGGRKSYLESHGNYQIYDYYNAIENGKIASDYHVWWGYEDSKLFTYAKEEILKLASKDEPFNFTMLTSDTHFPDGYLDSECEAKFDKNLSNVVYCLDNKLNDFIKWIQSQDFYENTTIVIVGDHVSMDANYFKNVTNYERTTYNLFINSSVNTDNIKNRYFSTMDYFPTTLASIGVEIEGNRLALGTNLFSDEMTLIEKYGIEYVREELSKKSNFYNNKILYGK